MTRRLGYVTVGLLLGAILGAALPAAAAWLVNGSGEASLALAELKPLGVSPARIDNVWPGDTVDVFADIQNPNARPVAVQSITLENLHADITGCATGTKFEASGNIVLSPGDTADLHVGQVSVPKGVAQKCVGSVLTGDLTVTAAYEGTP